MKLSTKRLILRDVNLKDARDMILNGNNLKIARYIPPFPYPYTMKEAKSFIKNCMRHAKERPRENYELGIQLNPFKKIIGMISITKIDHFQKLATVGYWLGERYWKNGYMTEALMEILDFCFGKLKLRKIDISAFKDNNASNALIRKMGFRQEGIRIKHLRVKSTGKLHDEIIYGMFKHEWSRNKMRLK